MRKILTVLLVLVFVFAFMSNAFACYYPETAWAVGNSTNTGTLSSLPGLEANKWGWYINAPGLESLPATYPVYAKGAKNSISKAYLIGTVTISNDGTGYYSACFNPCDVDYVTSTDLGVYDSIEDLVATGGAPGKFTNNVTIQDAKYIVIHFDAMLGISDPALFDN